MFNPYRDTQAFIKEHGTTPDKWLTMWLDPDLYCTLSDNTTNKETANWARSLLANEAPIGAGPIGPRTMLPPVDTEFETRAVLMVRIWDYIQTHTDLDAYPEHTQRIGFTIRYQSEYFATLRQRTDGWFVYPYDEEAYLCTDVMLAIEYLQDLVERQKTTQYSDNEKD